MSKNIYLDSVREQYETLQKSINGLQARAAEAKRDLTNEELRSVIDMGERAQALFTQIEDLSEIEVRNAKVAALNEKVVANQVRTTSGDDQPSDDGGTGGGNARSVNLGGATTRDRDPGFYTRGGEHSFMADQYRASKMGDKAAAERLARHTHAVNEQMKTDVHLRDVLGAGATTAGAGLVPPVWLAEEYAGVLHRRLRLARVLRQVPWAGPYPWTIPIAGTVASGTVVAEGVNSTETDPGYTTITVTPKAIMGYSEVSRQMLEASNPSVDTIIWGDLLGDLYDRAEAEVIIALEAVAGLNLATVADGAVATNARNGILDAIAAISDNAGGDADVFVSRGSRWVSYLKLTDTALRPLILSQQYNPSNAIGIGDATQGWRSPIQGNLENLAVVTSPTVLATRGYVLNSQEALFSMSPPMQFQFEQPAGPALIRIGVWGYEAVTFARRPKAVSRVSYTTN